MLDFTTETRRPTEVAQRKAPAISFSRPVAFAFDPKRDAILLVAGDKSGQSGKRFYRQLIAKADRRFDEHLERLKKERRKP